MSLMRRNIIAWVLILPAILLWITGLGMVNTHPGNITVETTATADQGLGTEAPFSPTEIYTTIEELATEAETFENEEQSQQDRPSFYVTLGYVLCFTAVGILLCLTFLLWQKAPVAGPDGIMYIAAVTVFLKTMFPYIDVGSWIELALVWLVMASVRELWGWIRCKCSLSWCAVYRLARRVSKPQHILTVYMLACFLPCAMLVIPGIFGYEYLVGEMILLVMASVLPICCVWQFGRDLAHFYQQLACFENDTPVQIRQGFFEKAETLLEQLRIRHKQAVQTAVTSERFKVELISNVSHDLRTPLTSILGYSELLEDQPLTQDGRQQLARLHQKAGYMHDLVEALFELTKVSSGAMQSKREKIDLIRLLEQTLGMYDEQITGKGLSVRRHYQEQSIPVITDGARMHQVFANLLENAIKYALTGTRIHFHVTVRTGWVVTRISNTASYEMDFEPEQIMERFARGDKARSTQGSGLGLAIAQTYTQSVGGTFRVHVDGDQFSAIVELPTENIERDL